uniref:Syndecan binding protein 2 n=3 Tax=Xenopus tropicalis TaxID=8364 RepID=A0A803J8V1_XENTR
MSIYPSLEDLKVDRVLQAQSTQMAQPAAITAAMPSAPQSNPGLYPNLAELSSYMGLSLTDEEIQLNMALLPAGGSEVSVPPALSGGSLAQSGGPVAPVTGNDMGLRRAEIKVGVREVTLCKDQQGKVGLRLRAIDKVSAPERQSDGGGGGLLYSPRLTITPPPQGIFVQLVQANTPASLVGLRFGDQVLQVDGASCAGWSTERAHKALKRASQDRISLIVRDRPFQRTVTLQKDSAGHVGFIYKRGQITSLVRDGSAARNGLLTNHYLCEINGQNVIGLKDQQVGDILESCGRTVTVTVMPNKIYEHMVKRLSSGLLKNSMDHSVPEV